MRSKILFLAIILVGSACKPDPKPNYHFDYFGMNEGRYVIYDVLDIIHDDDALIHHDTSRYQLKTVWGELYTDNEGREGKIFRRYIRSQSSDPWFLQDVWYGLIDGIRGEIIEENQRRVKLVFSPTIEKEWDANAYNAESELACYYMDIHEPYSISGSLFDSTVIVEQDDFPSSIDTSRKYEVWAKDIGLVYRHDRYTYYGFAQTEVKFGTEVYYSFVSSGFE